MTRKPLFTPLEWITTIVLIGAICFILGRVS